VQRFGRRFSPGAITVIAGQASERGFPGMPRLLRTVGAISISVSLSHASLIEPPKSFIQFLTLPAPDERQALRLIVELASHQLFRSR
jgi:hypothetical protein